MKDNTILLILGIIILVIVLNNLGIIDLSQRYAVSSPTPSVPSVGIESIVKHYVTTQLFAIGGGACGDMSDADCLSGWSPECFVEDCDNCGVTIVEGEEICATCYFCVRDEGQDCSDDPSMSLDCSRWCSNSGWVYDYGQSMCCSPDTPYLLSYHGCSCNPQEDFLPHMNIYADNYYTRRSSCGIFYWGACANPSRFDVETKCIGMDYYTCSEKEKWINTFDRQERVLGQCGIECDVEDEKCEGTTYYKCIDNIWANQGKVEGKCEYTKRYKLGANQLVAMESFSGGSTISRYSTRYPIVSFIYILPAIVIDANDNSVSTSSIIYNELDEGKTLQVPTNQVWSLFYVIENNYQLPTICDVVDVETGQCARINPGIVTACSEGQFDPALGLCVVQPESRIICPEGGRYDVAQAVCIFNPPLQAVCEKGVYNVNTEMCEYYPDEEYVCDSGFTYDSRSGKCVIYPDKQINCPGGYAYDEDLDKCIRYPDERIICPVGTTYNSITDLCEYAPPESYVCQVGFIYNEITGKCELRPAETIICGIGTYDTNLDLCVYEPQVSTVCSKGILIEISSGNYACIYTPESITHCPAGTTYDILLDKCVVYPDVYEECPVGTIYNSNTGLCEGELQITCIQGTYDADRNACVYSPNMEYLCIHGKLIYVDGVPQCTIIPEEIIICTRGFTYDEELDKCVIYPDYWITGIAGEIGKIPFKQFWEDYKIWIIIGVVLLLLLLVGGKRRR